MGYGYVSEECAHVIKREEHKNNDTGNHSDHAQLLMKPETAPSRLLR